LPETNDGELFSVRSYDPTESDPSLSSRYAATRLSLNAIIQILYLKPVVRASLGFGTDPE